MSDPKAKPKNLEAEFDAEQDLGAAFEAEPDVATAAPQPAPAPPPAAPELDPLDSLLETGNDALRGANQGLTWLGADELVGGANALATGGNMSEAIERERAMNALAEERSPIAYPLARAAGFVPGALVGGGRYLAGIGQGAVSGALGSNSEDWSDIALDSVKGAATNAGVTGLLSGGGRVLSALGGRLAKGMPQPGATAAPRPPSVPPPPAAAPPAPQQMTLGGIADEAEQIALPGMAHTPPMPMREPIPVPSAPPMQQPRWTAPGMRQLADEAAADPAVAQDIMTKAIRTGGRVAAGAQAHGAVSGGGFDPTTAGVTAATLAFPNELGAASQKLAPPMLRGAANVAAGVGHTANALGEGMQHVGFGAPAVAAGIRDSRNNATQPRIDDLAPPAPAQATASGRGNLLPQAALEALYSDAQALGKYQSDFAQAAVNQDANAVGALITRLTQTDPQFRQTVLPELQRRTAAPYAPELAGPRR